MLRHACTSARRHRCIFVRTCTHTCVRVCIYIRSYTHHASIYVHTHTNVCTRMHLCTYIQYTYTLDPNSSTLHTRAGYTQTNMQTHTHTHTHTHIHTRGSRAQMEEMLQRVLSNAWHESEWEIGRSVYVCVCLCVYTHTHKYTTHTPTHRHTDTQTHRHPFHRYIYIHSCTPCICRWVAGVAGCGWVDMRVFADVCDFGIIPVLHHAYAWCTRMCVANMCPCSPPTHALDTERA